MATPALFRFSMQKDANTFYGIDSAGNVVEQSTPDYLRDETGQYTAPDKWQDTTLQWKRSEKYLGVGYSITTPYEMVESGAKIMRYVYFTYGVQGKCKLIVDIRNDADYEYSPWYASDIDFSQFNGGSERVIVKLIESGITARLFANENTPYEIPILNADCKTIKIDGIKLRSTANYVLPQQGLVSDIELVSSPLIIPTTFDGALAGEAYQNFDTSRFSSGTIPPSPERKIYKATRPQEVVVTLTDADIFVFVPSTITSDAPYKFAIVFRIENYDNNVQGGFVPIFLSTTTINSGGSATFTNINNSINFTLNPGDCLVMYIALVRNNPGQTFIGGPQSQFKVLNNTARLTISATSLYPETDARAYHYWQVAEKMINLLGGNGSAGQLAFLKNAAASRAANWDTYPYGAMVTCGNALRMLGDGNLNPDRIKSTFSDLFTDASAEWQLALTQNNEQLDLVPLSEVFKDYEIADLGEVSELTYRPWKESMFNVLNIGGQKIDYDQLNGRDEFNQGQTYSLDFANGIQETAEWRSNWRKDMYGIEFTRTNLADKDTTDSSADNDTFVIGTTGVPVSFFYRLWRQYVSITGVLFPDTLYNGEFTPKRKTLRNGQRLRGSMHLRDNDVIKFQSGDKNVELVSNLTAGTVVEKSDIPVNSLPAPLYLPIIFEFTAETPQNLLQLMQTDPYGYFSFTYRGVSLKGFVMEIGVKPANHEAYQCRLLCHPSVNIAELINA